MIMMMFSQEICTPAPRLPPFQPHPPPITLKKNILSHPISQVGVQLRVREMQEIEAETTLAEACMDVFLKWSLVQRF